MGTWEKVGWGVCYTLLGALALFVFGSIIYTSTPEYEQQRKLDEIQRQVELREACAAANGDLVYNKRGYPHCELREG